MGIISQEELDVCKAKVKFSHDKEKVQNVIDDIAKDFAKNYKFSGYRLGKASVDAVKVIAKKQLIEAAKSKLLTDAFEDILFEKSWKPFGSPEVVDMKASFTEFEVEMILGYYPPVELKQYKDFEFDEPENISPIEFAKDKIIENICNGCADVVPFGEDDFLLNGDSAIINYDGKIDGKEFAGGKADAVVINIGAGNLIPGFEDNIIGMRPGEKREFEIVVDEKMPNPEVAGKTIVFSVELVSASRKSPVPFDESLAQKLNAPSFEDLQKHIDQQAEEMVNNSRFNALKQTVINKLLENEINVPEWMPIAMAKEFVKANNKSWVEISPEEMSQLMTNCIGNIKFSFIVDKVKELEAEAVLSHEELIGIMNRNLHKFPDNVRKEVVEGKNTRMIMQIFSDIQTEWIIKWVIEHSKIVSKEEQKGE